jgi:hypothetical protein
MKIILTSKNRIVELREVSVWNWREFSAYYEEILKYDGASEYEYFWRYFDASPEFQYIVSKALCQFGVSLADLSLEEAHKFIFEWAIEANKQPTEAEEDYKVAPWLQPPSDCHSYEVTIANLWASEMALTEVLLALKEFPQSTLTKVIKAYNWGQKTSEERYREWTKKKATDEIISKGLPSWDINQEVDLDLSGFS